MRERRKYIINSVIVVFSIVSSLALCINGNVAVQGNFFSRLAQQCEGNTLQCFIITLFLFAFYKKTYPNFVKTKKAITHIISAMFSLFMLIGISYTNNGNWGFLFFDFCQSMIAVIAFLGYFIFFDFIICLLYGYLSRTSFNFLDSICTKIMSYGQKHYRLFVFSIIAICWLPFLILNLPGSVPHDGAYQINMFFSMDSGGMSNFHPWLVSIFMGFFVKLGSYVSDNFGIFLIVIIMYLIEAYCYTIVCSKIYSWKLPSFINVLSISFFAFVPAFGGYAQAVIKDSLFTALFSVFVTFFVDWILRRRELNYKTHLLMFLLGLLVCLSRLNGIYIVIPTYFCMLFFDFKRNKKEASMLIISTLVFYYVIGSIIAPSLGVEDAPVTHSLTIPFQQTARYLKEYPNDLSDDEKRIINNVVYCGNYNPEISDPVKNTFHAHSVEEMKEYFNVYFRMFIRHPNVYFEATLNNTYGYMYPFYNCNILGAYQFYQKEEMLHINLPEGGYVFSEDTRAIVANYAELWRNIPILAELVNPGAYTWLLILLIGFFIYLRCFKNVLVFLPPMINVFVCISSPVNGLLRYAMPLMACAPVLIAFTCCFMIKKYREVL